MVFPWIFYGLAPVDFDTELIIFCLIHLLLVQVAGAIAVDSHMLQPVFQNSRIANTDIPETYLEIVWGPIYIISSYESYSV